MRYANAFIFAVALVVITLSSPAHVMAQAGLVLSESWNNFSQTGGVNGGDVDADNNYQKHGACYVAANGPHPSGLTYNSMDTTTDPCNASDNVLKVTNVIGDDNGNCTNGWKDAAGQNCTDPLGCYQWKHRAEVIPTDKTIRPDINEEYWIGWRTWVEAVTPNPPTDTFMLTQAICDPFDGTDWEIRLHTNNKFRHQQRRTAAGAARNDLVTDMINIPRNAWTNFVVHWIRREDGAGKAEVWVNGNQWVFHTGRSTQSNSPECLVKWGLYQGRKAGISDAGKQYIVYHDDQKIAYGANHFNTVSPTKEFGACSTPPPTLGDFPVYTVLDNFNRDNETVIQPPWANGVTDNASDCELLDNYLEDGTGKGECYYNVPMTTPQEVYGTWINADAHPDASGARLFACLIDTPASGTVDGYNLKFLNNVAGTDTLHVEKLQNGAYTQIGADFSQEITSGDGLGLRVNDSTGLLEVYFNDNGAGWVKLGDRTDGAPWNCSSSYIGVRSQAAQHHLDNFGGGPVIGAPNTNLLLGQQPIFAD